MSVRFYCCYLLQSSKKPGSFYIGSTPDPFRRIRQHNGDLANGGAHRTKSESKRPWRMVCCISGFQSQVQALQFEHALQHPYQTRHIPKDRRIVTSRQQMYRSLDKHLGNLRLLAQADAFSKVPLKVHLLEKSAHDAWTRNKFDIDVPEHVAVEEDVAQGEQSTPIGGGKLKTAMEMYSTAKVGTTPACPECQTEINLTELAFSSLQGHEDDDEVLPSTATCPACNAEIQWHMLARYETDSSRSGATGA